MPTYLLPGTTHDRLHVSSRQRRPDLWYRRFRDSQRRTWVELDQKTDKEILAFVEEKEIARNALSGSTNAATSGYRKRGSQQPLLEEKGGKRIEPPKIDSEEKRKLALKGKCRTCQADINLYTKFRSGTLNKEAFSLCRKCHKTAKAAESETGAIVSFVTALEASDPISQISSVSDSDDQALGRRIFRYASGSLAGGLLIWFLCWLGSLFTWLLSCSLNLGSGLLKYHAFGAVVLPTSCTSHCAPLELSHHIFTRDGWERFTPPPDPQCGRVHLH